MFPWINHNFPPSKPAKSQRGEAVHRPRETSKPGSLRLGAGPDEAGAKPWDWLVIPSGNYKTIGKWRFTHYK